MPPPEIPDRDHQWSEIEPELFGSMSDQFMDAMEGETIPRKGCFGSLPGSVLDSMELEIARIAGYPVERLVFFDHDGSIVEEIEGTKDMVRFEFSPKIFRRACIHNHPNGTPPSKGDVLTMAANEIPLTCVVTRSGHRFDIGPGPQRSFSELSFTYDYLDRTSWGVAEHCIRTGGLNLSDKERYFRRQTALLHELAERGLLCYGHKRWRI